jgi:hypothetical protein
MWEAVKEIGANIVESAQALLIVLGVVILVLGLAGGVTLKGILPIPEAEWRIFAAVAGLLLVLISVVFLGKASATPREAMRYGIKITTPHDGNHVGITNVEGTIKRRFPAEYTLHMLRIYPGSNGFIPMGVAEVDYKARIWRATGCDIGGRPGNSRIIGAYLVGPSGRVLFDYYHQANDLVRMLKKDAGKDDVNLPPLDANRGYDRVRPCRRHSREYLKSGRHDVTAVVTHSAARRLYS